MYKKGAPEHVVTPDTPALFTSLAEMTPTGVYVIVDGRFRFVNSSFSASVGFSRDEILMMDPLQIVLPEDREMVRSEAVKRLKNGDLSPYRYRARNRDGLTLWILESVRSITFEGRRATLGSF